MILDLNNFETREILGRVADVDELAEVLIGEIASHFGAKKKMEYINDFIKNNCFQDLSIDEFYNQAEHNGDFRKIISQSEIVENDTYLEFMREFYPSYGKNTFSLWDMED